METAPVHLVLRDVDVYIYVLNKTMFQWNSFIYLSCLKKVNNFTCKSIIKWYWQDFVDVLPDRVPTKTLMRMRRLFTRVSQNLLQLLIKCCL